MSSREHRAWLREFLKPLRPTFREVLVISFFVNTLALATPVFVMQVYDRVVFHGGLKTLEGLIIGMGLVIAFDFVLRQTRSRIMQRVALRIDVHVGRRLYDSITALPLEVLEQRPAAYWQTLFRDVDVVRNTLSGASALLLADLPFVVLFLVVVFVIATPIAWILLIVLFAFIVVAWRSGHVTSAANDAERQTTMNRDGLIAEMIAGRTTIKALALDGAMRPMWEDRHADNIERAIERGSGTDGYANLGTTLTMITTVAMTSFGALAIIDHKLTIGGLIATNMLSGRLLGPINQLVGSWRNYASFRQSAARLGQVFAIEPERRESQVPLDRPSGNVLLQNVTFAYDKAGAPVIDGITLNIRNNGVHALVGRNGCGKTTLLKLILGLYRPDSGRVLLDGADIAQFTRNELAGWIGYVPQDCVLFAGTIRDNIAYRMPEATDEDIVRAATAASVHPYIIDLPDGYATDIGEAGRRLSGGQRQRLAIARALIGDPPILLLDEPSSSLDHQTEQDLAVTLQEIGRTRTVVVVTHSPTLLAACANLIALDRGKVALAGPAKEILPRVFGSHAKPAAAAVAAPATAAAALAGGGRAKSLSKAAEPEE